MKRSSALKLIIMLNIPIFNYTGRITSNYGIIRNIFNDNTAGCHNYTFPDIYIPNDSHSVSQPYVIPYSDCLIYESRSIRDCFSVIIIMVLSNNHTFRTRMKIIANYDCPGTDKLHSIEITIISKINFTAHYTFPADKHTLAMRN